MSELRSDGEDIDRGADAASAASGPGAPAWHKLLQKPSGSRTAVHVHLLGIGGSGLSAISVVLLEEGYTVSGSDQAANEATADLAGRGARVLIGHDAANIAGAGLLLSSSAIPAGNPEIEAARAAGIPVVKRAEFLGALMAGRQCVGVAGTHGKTTTTAMLALILWRGGADPSFIVGGPLPEFGSMGSAARAGKGPFVIEADEYDRMFLGLPLQTAIVTNVEWDHVDCYPTPEAFTSAFRQFAGQLPAGGRLILCADDPGALGLRDAVREGVAVVTYGLGETAGWRALDLKPNALGGLDADVRRPEGDRLTLRLAVPGAHNVRNALAALAAAEALGVPAARGAAFLKSFSGAGRRFEVIGEAGRVTVIDDYGHHPTEIATTLAAARTRYGGRRIWAVFQPHTYTRFQALLDAYTRSFQDADEVVVLDIYASREQDDRGAHASQLLDQMEHHSAHYLGGIEAAARYLLERVAPGDVVITLSAGDGNKVGKLVLAGLRLRDKSNGRSQAAGGGNDVRTAAAPVQLTGAHQALVRQAAELRVAVSGGEMLARHTTFRIGGPADLFATATNVDQLAGLAALAHRNGLPLTVLGGGSNVLVSDLGVRGLVVANAAREVWVETGVPLAGRAPQVVADAGMPLAGLARWAMRAGYSGLEWAVSVPGTVGGAVIGNAGAHGGQIADQLAWALISWPDGLRENWTADDLHFAYRSSILKEKLACGQLVPVVLRAGFAMVPGNTADMVARADEFLARRRASQPVEPSAGSVFRNPPGDYAGRLIESAGLKGHRIGGAQVSPRHANFIVNAGDARAADVLALLQLIQARVRDGFGITLVPEILLLGDWPH